MMFNTGVDSVFSDDVASGIASAFPDDVDSMQKC